jgi:hypothetical protein
MNYIQASENLRTSLEALKIAISDYDRVSTALINLTDHLPMVGGLTVNDFEAVHQIEKVFRTVKK